MKVSNVKSFQAGWRPGGKLQRSLRVTRRRSMYAAKVSCKAVQHKEQEEQHSGGFNAKLQALVAAVFPMITALPAGAHEYQHYLQLASPGLAVVIGSLAYAAASPHGVRGSLFAQPQITESNVEPALEPSSTLKAEEQTTPFTETETTAASFSPQHIQSPHPTLAFSSGESAVTSGANRETDANGETAAKEPEVSFMAEGMETVKGRGRILLMAFAGQLGRSGSLSQGATASSLAANPLLKEKGILQTEETATRSSDTNLEVAIEKEAKPVSTVATDSPQQKNAAQMQAEHKDRIAGLKSQMSSLKVATTEPVPEPVQTPAKQQKAYNDKLGALKLSAAQKQREEEERTHKRASLVSSLNEASQERAQTPGVEPYSALARTKQAQGLAKLHPRALVGSFCETVVALWKVVINAAKRLFGQNSSAGRPQAA